MKFIKTFFILSIILLATNVYGQKLPDNYQAIFNEAVTNFKSIRSGNSITKGDNSLRVINDERIVLRTEHKKKVKNLTFVKKPNENNEMVWIADNQLTIDMVNKYEEFLTEALMEMLEYSREKAKE